MSKAEEEANKRYSITRGDDTQETSGIDMQRASDFIDCYEQAEKDNELTWKDIVMIDKLLIDLGMIFPAKSTPDYYQEVLKRFKDFKERKEK